MEINVDNILHAASTVALGSASVVGYFLREAFKDFKTSLAQMTEKQNDHETRISVLEEKISTKRRR